MRFKVPQNIDMPDRILGPLTMLQFVYAVVGFGGAYVSYMSLPAPIGVFFSALIAVFTIAMIFIKINERPFSTFLLLFIRFVGTPKQRVWEKSESNDIKVEIYKAKKTDTGPHVPHKNITHEEIARIAKRLDTNLKSQN